MKKMGAEFANRCTGKNQNAVAKRAADLAMPICFSKDHQISAISDNQPSKTQC
jgi:hypothetical protein